MACFYWLVGANRNILQAATELKSSSRRDDHRRYIPDALLNTAAGQYVGREDPELSNTCIQSYLDVRTYK